MTRPELAKAVAEKSGLTRKQAEKLIAALEGTITQTLEKGDKVIYSNFGAFYTVHYPSKVILHPKLGAAKKMIMLPTNVVKWMPAPNIKAMVNEGKIVENPTLHGTERVNLEKRASSIAKPETATTTVNPIVDEANPFEYTTEIKTAAAPVPPEETEQSQPLDEDEVAIPVRFARSQRSHISPNINLDIAPIQKTKDPLGIFEEKFKDGSKEEATFDGAIRLHEKDKKPLWSRFLKNKSGSDNSQRVSSVLGTEKISLVDSGVFGKNRGDGEIATPPKSTPTNSYTLQNPLGLDQSQNVSITTLSPNSNQYNPIPATTVAKPAATELPLARPAISQMTPNISYSDLSKTVVPKEILQQIPEKIARQYMAVPFAEDEKSLDVAMIDPEDIEAKEIIKKATQKNLSVHLATEEDINHILDQYQGLESEVMEAIGEADDEETIKTSETKPLAEEIKDDAPAARIVSSLLKRAIRDKASDIHLEPHEKEVRARFRIDGILHNKVTLPKEIHMAVVSRIKILASLKIDEQRLPQDGRFSLKMENRKVDFRVSTLPTAYGETIVMRILDKLTGILTIEQLGLSGSALKALERNIDKAHGMILVTGPTGSGKTTTLYALIDKLYVEGINIVTLEDPIEYEMPNINQSQVNTEIGFTFASGLRSLVRQDPDIIMIGEIRDRETAEMAVQSALTGHVVLSTLHTNDAAGAAPRLIDMGVEPFLLVSSLNIVIAERLARKICEDCKEKSEVPPEQLESIKKIIDGMPKAEKAEYGAKELVFYKGKGCKNCGDTGYRGRIGIFELLEVTEGIKSLIIEKASTTKILEQASLEGMVSLSQDGIIKALSGQTSLEEVWRVTKD